jgi:hypothetical protein
MGWLPGSFDVSVDFCLAMELVPLGEIGANSARQRVRPFVPAGRDPLVENAHSVHRLLQSAQTPSGNPLSRLASAQPMQRLSPGLIRVAVLDLNQETKKGRTRRSGLFFDSHPPPRAIGSNRARAVSRGGKTSYGKRAAESSSEPSWLRSRARERRPEQPRANQLRRRPQPWQPPQPLPPWQPLPPQPLHPEQRRARMRDSRPPWQLLPPWQDPAQPWLTPEQPLQPLQPPPWQRRARWRLSKPPRHPPQSPAQPPQEPPSQTTPPQP